MASAFETFVQVELPKRPFLNTDVPLESVLIRRGLGPRQLEAVEINEGEVLSKVGGVVQSVPITSLGSNTDSLVFTQSTPVLQWTITHTKNNEDALVQIYDTTKHLVLPDEIEIVDANTVVVSFNSPQDGKAVIIFA